MEEFGGCVEDPMSGEEEKPQLPVINTGKRTLRKVEESFK